MPWTSALILYSFGALFGTSIVCVARVIGRWRRGLPVVPAGESSAVPWGLIDLMVCLATIAFAQTLARSYVFGKHALEVDTPLAKIPPAALIDLVNTGSLATLVATALSLLAVRLRVGATGRDFGWDARSVKADVKLGASAFLVLAAPVFLMQIVLTQFFPSSHPLIEMIREHRRIEFFVANGISAVLVAPICEELLFRVLLLGWLRNLARRDLDPLARILGPGASRPRRDERSPVLAKDVELDTSEATGANVPSDKPRESIWPLVVSAALFALAHLSHGPDPIPLFFLSLGLGYLYQKTGRVLPCIVVHFLLNAWTMYLLLLYVYGS